jgi:hypothetical protein
MVHEAMIDDAVDPATGEMPEGFVVREPWLAAVGAAVAAGTLTVEAARSIRSGLGEPAVGEPGVGEEGVGVTAESLAGAVARLLDEASGLDADRLFKLARQLRDELDLDGIAVRERLIHEQRAFRRTKRPNGLSRFTLDPDLETAALLDDLFDSLLSPRRGGPRFVDPDAQAWAQGVLDDPRSNDQYLHDAITGLLRLGVGADRAESRRIVGSRTPAVRVLVTEEALATSTGAGRIEGMDIPISIDSVKRIACEGGNTDLCDGVLLCRHHHMLLHNNHWSIVRRGSGYWLIPPPGIDPGQEPIPLPSKSAALHDLRRERRRRAGTERQPVGRSA